MKNHILYLVLAFFVTGLMAQAQPSNPPAAPGVKWFSFEEGMKQAKKQKKKVILDIYTDWCGWCKKMDAETFMNPAIVDYLNSKFIAIKLDAEDKNPITFNGQVYQNSNPTQKRNPHQLAVKLTNGQLSYPTYLYMDSNGKSITVTKGYMQAEDLLPLLRYIGTESYLTMTWSEFTGLK